MPLKGKSINSNFLTDNTGRDVAKRDDPMPFIWFTVAEITLGHYIIYFTVAESIPSCLIQLATRGGAQQSGFISVFYEWRSLKVGPNRWPRSVTIFDRVV
jgi:hypothetical protein